MFLFFFGLKSERNVRDISQWYQIARREIYLPCPLYRNRLLDDNLWYWSSSSDFFLLVLDSSSDFFLLDLGSSSDFFLLVLGSSSDFLPLHSEGIIPKFDIFMSKIRAPTCL